MVLRIAAPLQQPSSHCGLGSPLAAPDRRLCLCLHHNSVGVINFLVDQKLSLSFIASTTEIHQSALFLDSMCMFIFYVYSVISKCISIIQMAFKVYVLPILSITKYRKSFPSHHRTTLYSAVVNTDPCLERRITDSAPVPPEITERPLKKHPPPLTE